MEKPPLIVQLDASLTLVLARVTPAPHPHDQLLLQLPPHPSQTMVVADLVSVGKLAKVHRMGTAAPSIIMYVCS